MTHTFGGWRGGEITIQIRGDFDHSYERAEIYINNVHRTRCNPGTNYGSYYTCGSFSVPIGSVTIQVRTLSYVSSMYVKIDFGDFHGSKVHLIHIFSPQKSWLGYCVSRKIFYIQFLRCASFSTKVIDQKN